MLEQRNRPRVERRREAVEDARVAVVGPDAEAVPRELGENLLLRGVRLCRPLPLLLLGGELSVREPLGKRRRPEHDDHPLAERHGRMGVADEAAPGHRPAARRRLVVHP